MSLRIFPGQGLGLPLLCDTPPPTAGLGITQSSSATIEESLCLLPRGIGAVESPVGGFGQTSSSETLEVFFPFFASLFRDFPFPG